MIPYAFEYRRPSSLDEATALLRSEPDARLLAGGQTLISAMKLRLANPATLIDIGRIAELSFIRVEEESILIGAGATHAAVAASREVQNALPALSELAHMIGDPAVRHMGTLGGSIANNDPAADYPAAALALSATIQTTERAIAADDFFTGMFATALGDGEIVTSVRFQIPRRAAYTKFRNQASRYGRSLRGQIRERNAGGGDGGRILRLSRPGNGGRTEPQLHAGSNCHDRGRSRRPQF